MGPVLHRRAKKPKGLRLQFETKSADAAMSQILPQMAGTGVQGLSGCKECEDVSGPTFCLK